MRPRGSIRAALAAHMQQLEQGAVVTWRDLAQALADAGLINMDAPGELLLVQRTVDNMVRAGEIPVVPRTERRPWSRRPLKLYGARAERPVAPDVSALSAAMFSMVA